MLPPLPTYPGGNSVAANIIIIHAVQAIAANWSRANKVCWVSCKFGVIDIAYNNIKVRVLSMMVIINLANFYKTIVLPESRDISGFHKYDFRSVLIMQNLKCLNNCFC